MNKNDLSTDDIFKFMDLYFNRYFVLYSHLYNSMNKFFDEDIRQFLENGEHTFFEKITKNKVIKYKFKYENISIKEPTLDNDVEPMFPSDARNRNLTYACKLLARVTQVQEIIDIATDEKIVKVVGQPEDNVPIANLPLMVRSKYCALNLYKGYNKNECEYDPGGYFIVNGSEKVVICQDRMVENKPLVFLKKDSGAELYTVQVNSKSYKPHGITQIISVKIKKDGNITIRVPILNEVNIFVLFRALGVESDRDIINYISSDDKDFEMIDKIRTGLTFSKTDKEGIKILTQEQAIEYLSAKLRVLKKYVEGDKSIKTNQKRTHILTLLQNNFLPHIEGSLVNKAYYLGYMINKLLKAAIGRMSIDDRDSYINKRVDLPGDLLMELFRQFYRQMLNNCGNFFKKRSGSDEEPLNIINQIKPNTIEQGMKASLLTGAWPRRKGVAQMMQRISYLQTLSFLRRVDAPGGDASTSKLTGPRHLHQSSAALLCCVTRDSEILQGDNSTVKRIDEMKESDIVTSVFKDTLLEEPSKIHNYFSKMPNKLFEIKTISGRKIKCSDDHPILVRRNNNYEMINADKLQIGDELITRHMVKHIQKEDNYYYNIPDINDYYKLDLQNCGYNKKISEQKLEIIARLIGANITDGHLHKINENEYNCSFFVGELNDAYEIYDDIQKLGFGSASIKRNISNHINRKNGIQTIHKTWQVSKNGVFAYFMNLMGVFNGDKTNTIRTVPEWIINGTKRIKREFLSGFQGGDGCKLVMQNNDKYNKLSINATYQTTNITLKEEMVKYMTQISNIFSEFDIINKLTTTKIPEDESKIKIGIYFEQSYQNLQKYADIINYKYCHEKQRKSASVIEYIKYKNNIANNKNEDYAKIINLYKEGIKPQEIVKQTNIQYQIVKRVVENFNKQHTLKAREFTDDSLTYSEFLNKYYIDNLNLAIPIESIKELPIEKVYDFETKLDSHTFIVNGIVTSNCVQTPEHAKVGLTKHLALVASITILEQSQLGLIKQFVKRRVTDLRDVNPTKIKNMTKVFINGEWVGVTDNAIKLNDELRKNKEDGSFNPLISIVWDVPEKEIRIYCDGGRLYRPVMKVENNEVKLTKNLLTKISLNKSDKSKGLITSWEEFLIENPGIIEYIDMEEQPYLMVCDKVDKLEEMRKQMTDSIENGKDIKTNETQNRYNDNYMYTKYSHCEFHPSLLIGEIVSNIPFCNHNAGPRNIFFYAQSKQGMGLYVSNYRDRLDISYILYHPQKPLITTRASKYNNTDIMASGENIVVAISTYTGFNQEDSIVFNSSSIDRGLFRSTSLKKEFAQIQKNQSTSQDDVFMKPNPSKVTGMKHGSYDKLNEKGYVPEETTIVDGDIIIGKVSPIQPVGNSNKVFKDSSVVYKSYTPGVIDKVYTNIYNSEGYEMRKVRIRSERVPRIGDKFSSRMGQKGTIGLYLRQSDMPFTKRGISPDIILNPHCFVGETQINMSNGLTKRIDQFSSQGLEKVLCYNKNVYDNNDNIINESTGTIESYSLGMESKGIKNTIKVVLEDGREIICTPDHKFPIQYNNTIIIKEAKDLTNTDNLISGFLGTEDKVYDDENEFKLLNFNMLTERDKVLAIARIVGYYKDNLMEFETRIDMNNYINDINITFGKDVMTITNLTIKLQSDISDKINNLQESINSWPKAAVREFIAARSVIDNTIYQKIFNKNITVNEYMDNYGYRYSINKLISARKSDATKFVKQEDNIIPTFNIKIKGLIEHKPLEVFDIGVANYHNFNANGIHVNNCIPSRMTLGQIIECIMGKSCAIKGVEGDGTPFNSVDIESIREELVKLGYANSGKEYLYNGMTGQKLKTEIFIGPTYYLRLKHLVEDKFHARARGPKTLLMHQPPEGRSRDGGLRLGEMERDSLLAHGIAKFLKEKLLDTSDAYSTFVCDLCGLFAQRLFKKDNQSHSSTNDLHYCPACKNYTKISKVMIPYAFKLVIQEMMAMNIAPRIRVEQDRIN